jgi:hypothetical protein
MSTWMLHLEAAGKVPPKDGFMWIYMPVEVLHPEYRGWLVTAQQPGYDQLLRQQNDEGTYLKRTKLRSEWHHTGQGASQVPSDDLGCWAPKEPHQVGPTR